MAKMRDDHHELGELKRVVVSLLQNIDMLSDKVVLVAATNHAHLLDPAVWRRFAYQIQLPLPDEEGRVKILNAFLGIHSPGKAVVSAGRPVTIFLDNARYQHCALVMETARDFGISLQFLPTYSPNLNLIERFWKYVKKECLASRHHAERRPSRFRAITRFGWTRCASSMCC